MNDVSHFLIGINKKNDKAWKQLYHYFYASLCNYSAKIIGDSETAEDVVQNCLVRLYDSTFNFPDIKAVTAYLYRSVYHHSLNVIRNKKSSEQIHQEWFSGILDHEEEADIRALEEEVIGRFYIALNELPAQQREILWGSLKGEKVRDIAVRLKVSENSVKTQKKRAYFYLRQVLGDMFPLSIVLFFSEKFS